MSIEFEIKGVTCWIDDEDADLLDMGWYISTKGYATRNLPATPKRGRLYLHRLILARMLGRPLTREEECDHENLNKTDNRRANLRVATRSQNEANKGVRSDSATGYKGVRVHRQKFAAQIYVNGKRLHLGTYDTPEEAHTAYLAAAREYFGEFARGE